MRRRALFLLASVLLAVQAMGEAPGSPESVRAAFHKIIDRPNVALDPELKALTDYEGLKQVHLEFTAEPGQRVPAVVLAPKSVPTEKLMPVVIVLHGTGGRKEDELAVLAALAHKGFLAIAMDGRYHGERCAQGKGTVEYFAAIERAYQDVRTHPWLYDTVYDVTRLLDYLESRPDVDPKRIGLMGFSKGGMETYLTAAVDQRVAVAVPCISVQSFAYGLENDLWHKRIGTVQGAFDAAATAEGVASPDRQFVQKFYDRVIPGIYGPFDCPNVLPMICPRPLLTINGETDAINPIAGAKVAIDAASKVYAAQDAKARFKAEIEPGVGHQVTPEYVNKAVEWFVTWLMPQTP